MASPAARDARRAMASAVNAEFRKWVATHEELASEAGPYAAAADALADLATGLVEAGADASGALACARAAVELQRGARRAALGLGRAAAGYEPPASVRPFAATDFGAMLEGVSDRVDGGDDGGVGAAVVARLDALDAAGADGDVVAVQGVQLARNERCPVTGKNILDLTNPVTDTHGFVYERDSLLALIAASGRAPSRGAPKQMRCPMAGTEHTVSEAGLKVAVRVVRAQQAGRRRRGGGRVADVTA